ncbi:TRAP transporter small permease [Aurantimonas sp. HBX-1]|uniref:TRAP transporter small permease n=1 Tax=Aurantimonas sp. HBX-1 TaxID=2906072 RepID=UPI001F40F8A7|nr:TRAP transporter small permease subunit [Aurantimonas sp. HBX-1]UIJ72652.1 TRAP transporter small permease subunit [Aurantimonas sp. HBX-1]
MAPNLVSVGKFLRRRAENALAAMLAVMFLAFVIQIVFRYLLDLPIGWTHEISVIMWIWMVLWGAAFVLTEAEEIRFDIFYGGVGARTRRVMVVIFSVALVVLYTLAMPAVWDYVTFMRVQETSYLDLRFDYLFSIYVVFALASIVRYIWLGWRALAGEAPDDFGSTKTGSGV